mgnify:CR=1 FL=1
MTQLTYCSKNWTDINIDFFPGKVNFIIGRSGQGKSVLLKCMVGLLEPNAGSVLYDGVDFLNMNEDQHKAIRQEVGMLFQGAALFDSMTIAENVMFPLKMFTKQSISEMEERVNSALKRVNLENAHQKMPSEASGGMQKRVAIARAIVNNPKYLFCDEPNSGLDPKTAIVIDNLIQEITKEYDIVTVINSHDMNSVMEIGEKIIFLKDGLKAWEGNKDTIFKTDNEVVTDFVYSSNLFKKVRKMYLGEL